MTSAQARSAVSVSALVVGGVYLYRRLVETPGAPGAKPPVNVTPAAQAAGFLGAGPVAPVGRFVTGWGVVYVVLAVLAEGEPDLAGLFAGLVATGALLGNGASLAKDIQDRLNAIGQAPPAGSAAPTVSIDWSRGGVVTGVPATGYAPGIGVLTNVPPAPAGGFRPGSGFRDIRVAVH